MHINIKAKIILYIIVPNIEEMSYDILSEHPDRFEPCFEYVNDELDLDTQVDNLYGKYTALSSSYVKFINFRPYIKNNELVLPYYCIIPYNSYEFKNSYLISYNKHANSIPDIRKIINII